MPGKKLITFLSVAAITFLVLRAAFAPRTASAPAAADAAKTMAPATQLAMNTTIPATAGPDATPAAKPDGDAKTPPPVAENDSDGKTVLSDGKTVLAPDGKETLGKETLPPVGEMVGQQQNAVDPGQLGPPPEYVNSNTSNSNANANPNPLLAPPQPVNISGPVVSAETR